MSQGRRHQTLKRSVSTSNEEEARNSQDEAIASGAGAFSGEDTGTVNRTKLFAEGREIIRSIVCGQVVDVDIRGPIKKCNCIAYIPEKKSRQKLTDEDSQEDPEEVVLGYAKSCIDPLRTADVREGMKEGGTELYAP